MSRGTIWFVTPAWGRFELTAVCLEQRVRVCHALAEAGVGSNCVVVADDENLDTARSLGFATVERDNEWLGRRFNDGIEYAARHGATWIVPIGSDSWIDPAYLLPLPSSTRSRTSAMYAAVTGTRMAVLRVGRRGAGPYMLHRSTLPASLRPAEDELHRYIDTSTIKGLTGVRWERRDIHALQYIGFRGRPHLTSYDRLMQTWGERESEQPWEELVAHYPADLVERARAALA